MSTTQEPRRMGIELRLVADDYSPRPSDSHLMDRVAEAIGKVNNITVAFAYYDLNTGKRIRMYGPWGEATPDFLVRMARELEEEDIPA